MLFTSITRYYCKPTIIIPENEVELQVELQASSRIRLQIPVGFSDTFFLSASSRTYLCTFLLPPSWSIWTMNPLFMPVFGLDNFNITSSTRMVMTQAKTRTGYIVVNFPAEIFYLRLAADKYIIIRHKVSLVQRRHGNVQVVRQSFAMKVDISLPRTRCVQVLLFNHRQLFSLESVAALSFEYPFLYLRDP